MNITGFLKNNLYINYFLLLKSLSSTPCLIMDKFCCNFYYFNLIKSIDLSNSNICILSNYIIIIVKIGEKIILLFTIKKLGEFGYN